MDKIKLTQEQYKYFGIGVAATVLTGMEDLIEEAVDALEDDEAQELWVALMDRINLAHIRAGGVVQFDVEG